MHVAESFFKSLKVELGVQARTMDLDQQAELSILPSDKKLGIIEED